VQSRYFEEPATAVAEADSLVARVMIRRGYPASALEAFGDDPEDEPEAPSARPIRDYHEARALALASAYEPDVDHLRLAMLGYRRLLDGLLDTPDAAPRALQG
jgi:hypothetical protein